MAVFAIIFFVKDYCSRGEVYFASVYKDIRRIPALKLQRQGFEKLSSNSFG